MYQEDIGPGGIHLWTSIYQQDFELQEAGGGGGGEAGTNQADINPTSGGANSSSRSKSSSWGGRGSGIAGGKRAGVSGGIGVSNLGRTSCRRPASASSFRLSSATCRMHACHAVTSALTYDMPPPRPPPPRGTPAGNEQRHCMVLPLLW